MRRKALHLWEFAHERAANALVGASPVGVSLLTNAEFLPLKILRMQWPIRGQAHSHKRHTAFHQTEQQ